MEEKKEIKEGKEGLLGFIILVVAVILIGVGIGLLIVMPNESGFSDKKKANSNTSTNTASNVENTNIENNNIENNNTENGNIVNGNLLTEDSLAKLMNPYLIFSKCGGLTYLTDTMTYDSLDLSTKLNITFEQMYINRMINSTESQVKVSKADILKTYKQVFGQDKEIEFPASIEVAHRFASYELQGEDYVLLGQGGGCAGIAEVKTKLSIDSQDDNSLVVKVDYGYVEALDENFDYTEFETTELAFYNSYNKERIIKQGFTHNAIESITNEIFNNNENDYILYTFKIENDHYIFDNAKIVKR